MAPSLHIRFLLLLLLCARTHLSITALATSAELNGDEDLDLLDLDEGLEEDPKSPPSSSSSSQIVSLALQKKALVQLSDSTASSFVASREYVLLLGFAPWCTRSSEIMLEFAAASLEIQEKNIPITLARLDAVSNTRSASQFGIKGFPTLLFFTNGSSERYTGGLTRDSIAVWIKKHTGTPVTTVSSKEEAEKIVKQGRTTVVGFFNEFKGPEYEAFISVAREEEETEFAQIDNPDLADILNDGMYKAPPFLSIIKNVQESHVIFEDVFEKSKIHWFVEVNKRPLVTKVEQINYMRLFMSPIKLQVTLFADSENSKKLLPLFQDVAKSFKGQLLFLFVDTANEELSRPTLTLYGLDADQPVIAAFNYENGLKYLFESNLSVEALKAFCDQLATGVLQPYYKSQPIPKESDNAIKIVVGKNFQSIVLDDSKDVFLEVYTQWCTRRESANKAFEMIAKHFKDVSDLVIAKIDAGENEHALLEVEDYPSFLFYPANNKTNPILAPKKWSTKKLLQFVHEHATVPLIYSTKTDNDESNSSSTETDKDESLISSTKSDKDEL